MEEGASAVRSWEDLPIDILVRIFRSFDVLELTSVIADVCPLWHLACYDPLLWESLDLSMIKSNFIRIPVVEPYVYVHTLSDQTLTCLLKTSLKLSRGHIRTLIFHFNLYLSNDQFTYTAESCPQLRRLVMPAWNRIEMAGICRAIHGWKDLESLTMPSIADPQDLIEEISLNCRNFCELKVMGPFDVTFASALTQHLPNLKVLSLRCSMVTKDALMMILDLPNLEVLNISHCLLIELQPSPAPKKIIKKLDQTILEKADRLREFLTCMDDACVMCQRTRIDEGLIRWYLCDEGEWKKDEAPSLALGSGHFRDRILVG